MSLMFLLLYCLKINVISSIRCGHDDVVYDITRNDHIEPIKASPKLFSPLTSLSAATGATKWLLNKIEDTHPNTITNANNIANNDIIQTFSSRKNTKPHRHHSSPHAFEHNTHHRHHPLPNAINTNNLLYINEDENDNIDSSIWKPFRIHYNSSSLVSSWQNHPEATHFADDVIPAAMHYLEKSLYVRPIAGKLKLSRPCAKYIIDEETGHKTCIQLKWNWETCGSHVSIPSDDFEETTLCELDTENADEVENCKVMKGGAGHSADIIIYFSGDGAFGCSDVYGYSAYCHSNKYDRPIAGFVNLCEDTLVQANRIFTWEQKVTLIVHEVFHVLGFSSTGFAYYRYNDAQRTARTRRDVNNDDHPQKKASGDYRYGSNTIQYHKVRDKFATFIVLPTVIKYARKFFQCSSVIGIELEDFGGHDTAASHWEQRILGYEFMIGYIPPAAPFSIFSFAVLQDSGWYKVNWKFASSHPYGRQFGCDWIDKKCLSAGAGIGGDGFAKDTLDPSTFCTSDIDYGCSKDHIAISNCQIEEYNFELAPYFQYFGAEKNANLGGRLEYADYCPMYYHYNNGDCRFVDASIKHKRFGATITPQSKCIIISHPDYHYLNLKMQGLDGDAIVSDDDKQQQEFQDVASSAHMFARRRRKKPLPKELGVCYKQKCFVNSAFKWSGMRIEVWNMEYDESEWITCWKGLDDATYKITVLHEYDIRCPIFDDICYDDNPWLCNGHGMFDKYTHECVCNAGYIGCDCLYDDTKENREKYPYSDHKKCIQHNVEKQGLFDKAPVGDGGTHRKSSHTLDILHDILWSEIDVHFARYHMILFNVKMDLNDKTKYIGKDRSDEQLNIDFINVAKVIKLLIAVPLKIESTKVWISNYKIIENKKRKNVYNIDVILIFENQQKMSNKQLSYQINKILHKLFDEKVKMEIIADDASQDDEEDNNNDARQQQQDGLTISTGQYLRHNSTAPSSIYYINIIITLVFFISNTVG